MRQIRGTVNHIELIGWLGDTPEQRTFSSGSRVSSFRVATKRWAGRNEQGELQIETDWTPVEAWEKLADRCNNALHKGSRVLISGSLHSRSWEDKESGQRRYRTVVRADDIMFLDARPENNDVHETERSTADVEDDEDVPF